MMGKHRKGTVVPRETIFVAYPNDPTSGPPPFQVQVGWQTDHDVQLGIATPDDDRHLVDYIYAAEEETIGRLLLEAIRRTGRTITDEHADPRLNPEHDVEFTDALLGRMVLDAVTGSTPFGTSVWATLPRHPINQLVRLLRKARDSAYGADA